MKRVVICICILCLLAGLTVFSAFRVNAVTNHILELFDTAQKQNSTADYAMLSETLDALDVYYEQNETFLFLFLRRDYVLNPQCSFTVLRAYASPENQHDFEVELRRARAQIVQLRGLFFSIS